LGPSGLEGLASRSYLYAGRLGLTFD